MVLILQVQYLGNLLEYFDLCILLKSTRQFYKHLKFELRL